LLDVEQMTGVLVGDVQRERVTLCPGLQFGEELGQVHHFFRDRAGAAYPGRVVSCFCQSAVHVFHAGTAPGGVDHDPFHVGCVEALHECLHKTGGLGQAPGMTTSHPSRARTRAVAVLTSGKNAPWTHPTSMPTRARARPTAGTSSGSAGGGEDSGGAMRSMVARVGDRRSNSRLRRTGREAPPAW